MGSIAGMSRTTSTSHPASNSAYTDNNDNDDDGILSESMQVGRMQEEPWLDESPSEALATPLDAWLPAPGAGRYVLEVPSEASWADALNSASLTPREAMYAYVEDVVVPPVGGLAIDRMAATQDSNPVQDLDAALGGHQSQFRGASSVGTSSKLRELPIQWKSLKSIDLCLRVSISALVSIGQAQRALDLLEASLH